MMTSSTWAWPCLLLVFCLASHCDCANILALMTTPSHSHHFWNRVLVRALAERGHHVTVFSPDWDADAGPNVTQILIEGAYVEDTGFELVGDLTTLESMSFVFYWGQMNCQHGMHSEGMRSLLATKDTKFDLVIAEVVVMECYWGLVHKFGSPPLVALTAYSRPDWADAMVGTPGGVAYVPDVLVPYTDRMDFWQRAHNAFVNLCASLYRQFVHLPLMDAMSRARLGPSTPSVADIERNVSLVLVNTQIGVDHPRPTLPAMVPVGGLHLRPAKPLNEDLQKWMDEAENGVIFFSLGSNLRSDKLTGVKLAAILSAFSRLPQRVLWKYESPDLPGKPDNVRIEKWLPQTDILGHPNTVLFISHCGLLSTQEAIYFGVPVVGMPFFADQFINLARMRDKGVAEGLVYKTLTADTLLDVVTRLTGTPSYQTKMREMGTQFRDLPQHPLSAAVFWIEYVMRHKGAHHLRSASLTLNWVQLHLLDVMAAAALAAAVALWAVCATLKMAANGFRSKSPNAKRKKQ